MIIDLSKLEKFFAKKTDLYKYIPYTGIIDNLTTNNSSDVLSAKQGKVLNDNKLDKTDITISWSSTTSDTKVPSEKLVKDTIPSASSITPSADTTNGSVGTGTTWAKADHTHPKSSLYAESEHEHETSDLKDINIISVVVTYTDDSTETLSMLTYKPKPPLLIIIDPNDSYFNGVQLLTGRLHTGGTMIEEVNYDSVNNQFKFENVPYGEYYLKITLSTPFGSASSDSQTFIYDANNFEYNRQDIFY